jgi:single-strand DNA-binding protein
MSSKSINKVLLMGNLTRDPELRTTPTGAAVCTFGMATNSRYKNPDGNVEEITNFHNIVAWSKLAEICAKLLKKGTKVFVEGELRTRKWEDNGVQKQKTEVRITDMSIVREAKNEDHSREPESESDSRNNDASDSDAEEVAKDLGI